MHTTLITPAALVNHLDDPSWVVVDCRFDLTDTGAGERQFLAGHIPGARYAHLDRDLSATKTGANGRHPLPSAAEMRERFGRIGITASSQVVAYDTDSGMYAARLWWMLRYMGHDRVAVLDGGFARWVAEGGATAEGPVTPTPAVFHGEPRADWRLTVTDVAHLAGRDKSPLLVDARSPERFRGQNETLDPVGGHIPGAASCFFQQNLTADKTFKPAAELRAQYEAVLAGRDPGDVVMYCGSGVTACHNLLAMEVAGLSGARLYPGSWSEWCADPTRPVEAQ